MKPTDVREGTEDSDCGKEMEDAECCAEKKGKSKCSACKAGKPCMGRSDALTSQDYLDACDLGIADRSRPYIRARLDAMTALTPSALRSDKKCGASSIPDNKQCRVGSGGAPAGRQRKPGRLAKAVGAGLGTASAISAGINTVNAVRSARKGNLARAANYATTAGGSALATKNYFKGNIGKGYAAELSGTLAGVGVEIGLRSLNRAARSPGARTAARRAGEATGRAVGGLRNAMRRPNTVSGSSMGSGTPGRRRPTAGQRMYQAAKGASYAAGRAAGAVSRVGRRRSRAVPYGGGMPLARRRRDAIWADGFTLEPAALTA